MVFSYERNRKQNSSMVYLEKPFRNYYAKAKQMEGMTGENLMVLAGIQTGQRCIPYGIRKNQKRSQTDR